MHLKGLSSLQTLDLRGTKITDAGLVHLKGLTKLQTLYLSQTQITDAGLVHLKGLTHLKELSLEGTRVTGSGLVHLKGLTKLQTLYLGGTQITDLELRDELFDDFCLHPFHPRELEARLRHLFWRTGLGTRPELVEYGELVLNLETYQAAIEGKALDLTYMEYELLKFLASHPGKVFTRETLLSRVWGYEYYGGARTVDVHVRRLRAKLGEEHAGLIQTVRSVGYRFGQSRWGV